MAVKIRGLPTASRRLGPNGFTLLELIVVLVIAAIVASMVSLSLTDRSTQRFDDSARQVAALFDLALSETELRGHPLAWQPVSGGYCFLEYVGGRWQLMNDDVFRTRQWVDPSTVARIEVAGVSTAAPMVRFGLESIAEPVRVRLESDSGRRVIVPSVRGRYELQ